MEPADLVAEGPDPASRRLPWHGCAVLPGRSLLNRERAAVGAPAAGCCQDRPHVCRCDLGGGAAGHQARPVRHLGLACAPLPTFSHGCPVDEVVPGGKLWRCRRRRRERRRRWRGNSPLEHLRGLLRLEGGNRRKQFGQRGRLPCRDWPGRLSGRFTLRALARSVVLGRGAAAWARTAVAETLGCPPRGPVGILPAMLRTVLRRYPWRQEDLAAQRMSTHAAKDHWPTHY